MADQDLDRNEAATPYKLQKAREKGRVGKSTEVAASLVFTVAAVHLYWQGWDALAGQFRFDHAVLALAGRIEASAANLWHVVATVVMESLLMLLPLLGAVSIAAILGNVAQTGPVLSFEPVKPDFSRLNPATGLKKIFSLRTLFDSARAVAKLVLLAFVVYHAVKALVPHFLRLAALSPVGIARALVSDIAALALKIALLLLFIAACDWAYTRREFAANMRMSRRELKDEHKHREGDPRIRARLRELRREALRRSMAARNTSRADVVLTNPTHYAVALRYVHGEMASPQLVAKGSGSMAWAMRKIAARHRIPVVPNPPLARELYRSVDVEHFVPPSMYAQVARILVWVFAMRDARGSAARAGA